MAISIVRLASPRGEHEGLRIGTVRRPPRGVPKIEFASRDYYDVWLPNLAPSAALMAKGRAATSDAEWQHFEHAYRKEMAAPDAAHLIDTLAALSHTSAFALGCYCERASRCHRGILRQLLSERGAALITS
ncbi:MAG TPA: DUF488 family protein [Telluria sp.]|jgi:uncharacterized protein YeaO (DUF488 family)